MNGEARITGRVVSAARALAGVGRADFAIAAGLHVGELFEIETSGSAWVRSTQDAEALRRGLEHFGVIVLDETDGLGAGVRLKLTRQDVRQVARLENEGGTVAADDAP